jgi:hypothetical protein
VHHHPTWVAVRPVRQDFPRIAQPPRPAVQIQFVPPGHMHSAPIRDTGGEITALASTWGPPERREGSRSEGSEVGLVR